MFELGALGSRDKAATHRLAVARLAVGSKNSNGRVAVSQATSIAVPEAAQYNFADGS